LAALLFAHAGAAADPPPLSGATIISLVRIADGSILEVREHLGADGALAATAGAPGEPSRYAWTGRWDVDGDRLCLSVPATNTRGCVRLAAAGEGLRALRPMGKSGRVPKPDIASRLGEAGPAIHGWTIPALTVLLARRSP
jgi:hypothetical protein